MGERADSARAQRRGIAPDLVEAASRDRSAAAELETAVLLLEQRLAALARDDCERDRAWRMLVRRGYSPRSPTRRSAGTSGTGARRMTSAPPDADIRLYYRPAAPRSRRMAVARRGGRAGAGVRGARRGRCRSADDVRLNPMGVVPMLVHGDVVVTEAAAVVQYVADTWPDAALLPRPGTASGSRRGAARVPARRPAGHVRFLYPERYTTGADASGVREAAVVALERQLGWLESVVAGQRALLGVDVSGGRFFILHMLIRWGRRLDPDARTRGALGPYYRRLSEHRRWRSRWSGRVSRRRPARARPPVASASPESYPDVNAAGSAAV